MEISPVEFEQGHYTEKIRNREVVVWYAYDSAIEYVSRHNDLYHLCRQQDGDSDLVARARPYEVCMTVLPYDRRAFREECLTLVENLPDTLMLSLLAELRGLVGWEMERMRWERERIVGR